MHWTTESNKGTSSLIHTLNTQWNVFFLHISYCDGDVLCDEDEAMAGGGGASWQPLSAAKWHIKGRYQCLLTRGIIPWPLAVYRACRHNGGGHLAACIFTYQLLHSPSLLSQYSGKYCCIILVCLFTPSCQFVRAVGPCPGLGQGNLWSYWLEVWFDFLRNAMSASSQAITI